MGFEIQGGFRGQGQGVYVEVFPSEDRRVAARGFEFRGLGFRFSGLV